MRGVLITFEGVEGSGKSTQIARLQRSLKRQGYRVEQTAEPDGTELGQAVRQLFELPRACPTPLAEVFLFMAARQQHVNEKVRPWLQRGRVVLCDRYADATLAYQGYGRGVDHDLVRELNLRATGGVLPDLTLLFDLPPAAGLRRIDRRRLDRFERETLAFHRRVRRGYLEILRVCGLARSGPHPDIHLIVPTPPESNPKGPKAIRIGAIRELERQASLRPALAQHKVFILDDADRMTGEAPQAFLKTLEEPPARTVLVLVLERPRAVPATVLSRCQIVRFAPRRDERATAERDEALDILADVRAKGVEALFRRAGSFDRDRERAERVVDAYWWLCRDLVLAKCGAAHLTGDADSSTREAEAWSWDDLWTGLAMCREAREALAVNVTPRLTLEVLLSRLALRMN